MGNLGKFASKLPALRNRTLPATTTLDPLKKQGNLVLSNGNMTVTQPSPGSSARVVQSVTGQSTGKYYFEVYINGISQPTNQATVGLTELGHDLNTQIGFQANSIGWISQNGKLFADYGGGLAQITFGDTWAAGDVIGMACDFDNEIFWMSKNGVWQASGDPAAGTNPAYSLPGDIEWYITLVLRDNISLCRQTLRTEAGDLSYTKPTGFGLWY